MKGVYTGFYKYGSERIQKMIKHPQTNFIIEITDEGDGTFSGTVKDDQNTGGTPGTGNISGKKNGNSISFIKQMPVLAKMAIDAKTNTLEKVIDPEKLHKPIHYSGIEYEKGKYKGKWIIKTGSAMTLLYSLLGIINNEGYWEMRKED